jgi:hypothetical protein
MSVRQRAAKDKAARQGIPHGGRRRFGYESGMSALREDEAEVVRDLASRLLAGESLHSCAKWLNGERPNGEHVEPVATPGGGARWKGSNLATMMLRPHLAGLRVHQGEVIGDADWPAILSVEVHESLKALLRDPERRTSFTDRSEVPAGRGGDVRGVWAADARQEPTWTERPHAGLCLRERSARAPARG